ncbi:MAG: DNA internalization-related competence protein ComEC/Rec2, partial [Candidatus Marinimicrobia bacterium]|nr:DNA internalization-related competence protein ComEC/Rec2 [Candidatus Neomarinimicrobiota bacterium]
TNEPLGAGTVEVSYGTSRDAAGGEVLKIPPIAPDGKPHTWSLDYDPEGRMYALEDEVDRVRQEEAQNRAARADQADPAVSIGLQGDAIQPLTIRVNQGECLRISLRNGIEDEPASLHIHESAMYVKSTGAAAIATLLISPKTLFTASFQLSFAAVAGILHVSLRLRGWIRATPRGAWLYQWRAARYALDLLLISLGAQVGTLPVTLSIFHAFSAYALLANLLAVPLAGFAVVGGAVSFIAAAVWPALGDIFAQALWLDLTVLMLAVEQLSRLPHPQVLVGQPGVAATLILLAAAAGLPYLFKPGRPRWRLRLAALVLLIPGVLVWRSAFSPRELRVTFLDVGQGDAIHLALPDGSHVLLDAGIWTPRFDAGERVVWPYLRGQGIGRLAVAAISHPQADHLGGLPYLLRQLPIGELWDSAHQVSNTLYNRTRHLADSLGVPIRRLQAGDFLSLGAVEILVLSPDSAAATAANVNNASLVLLLHYGQSSLLLMGDAERSVERRLLAYGELLQADWLKVGHHGSATSSTAAFLQAVGARGAVISVGARNVYRHPSPEVVERLRATMAVVHRTDLDGALVLRSDGYDWTTVKWR